MKKEEAHKQRKLGALLGGGILFVVGVLLLFYSFGGFNSGFNWDEEKYVRGHLSEEGYEVNDVRLIGNIAYVEMNASGTNTNYDVKNNFNWTWQVWNGMNTLAGTWEVEPLDIEDDMSKKELRELGVDYSEVPYMSDEELAQVSEIIGKRASTYMVKMHTPQEVCSYRLSRATFRAWERASNIDVLSDASSYASTKMDNEIRNSKGCS